MDETTTGAGLYEAIFKRKSVRSYAATDLDEGILDMVMSRSRALVPLRPGIRAELRLVPRDTVKGLFKVEAPHFLAFFSEAKEGYLENAGFMLQQMDLFLSANSIGSCWQGGPKPVGLARTSSGLEFVILLAFGRPAEAVQRTGAVEFKRAPLAKIADAKGHEGLLEPARLAPSAANNQPWYFKREDSAIHAYSAKSLVMGRLNRISTGIAMCHLWLAAEHSGGAGSVFVEGGKGPEAPRGYSYVASYRLA